MVALLGNFGAPELVLIAVIAVLIFGKDLPQAASKAYLQIRKLRNAVDDLRRDSGIDRELRDIERTVREAEWEARRRDAASLAPTATAVPPVARSPLPPASAPAPTAPAPTAPAAPTAAAQEPESPGSTGAAS